MDGHRTRWRLYVYWSAFCILAATQLLSDPLVLQHAPLLSPVLPEPIKDNQWTKQLSGEARKEATIHVMARVLELKLGGAPH